MRLGAAAAAILLLACARSAAAQETGPEETPSSPPAPRWGASVRMQEARDSNPALAAGAEFGSWITSVGGAAFRSFIGRRARLSLAGEAALERYHSLPGLDQFRWSGTASTEIRLAERTRFSAGGSGISTYARDVQAFLDQGLILPATPVRHLTGTADVSQRISVATTLSFSSRYEGVNFESAGLADGFEWGIGTTLARALGPRHGISLTYALRRSESGDQRHSFHSGFVGWKGPLGRRVTGDAKLGLLYRGAELEERPFDFEAEADLGYQGRRVGFGAHYSRQVHQAYGLGIPQLADVGSVRVDWKPASVLTVVATSSLGWSRDPFQHASDFRSRTHLADVYWSPTRLVTVATGYAYLRRVPESSGAVSVSHIWKTSFSVGRSWR